MTRIKNIGHILFGSLIIAGVLFPELALAQDDRQRLQGLDLARDLCSGCHVVTENQRGTAIDGAPSFPMLGRSGRSNDHLRVWLSEPHPVMPQMPLSEEQIAAVIAYIRSFAD
jgi:mono/diheme cytochrome c family protein